jgi:hypothetical protein
VSKKYTKVFKSTHSGIILREGVKAIKKVAVIPLTKYSNDSQLKAIGNPLAVAGTITLPRL